MGKRRKQKYITEDEIEKPFAFFSHKHAAYLAGMGSFGHNNVLLTPQYGPRVRFTSIFTTAEIPPDPIRIKDLCIKCLRCVKSYPVGAIPLKGDFPPHVDKKLCAVRSAKLRDEYRSPCGICIKVCPVGKDRELYGRRNMSIYSGDERSLQACLNSSLLTNIASPSSFRKVANFIGLSLDSVERFSSKTMKRSYYFIPSWYS